MKLMRSMAITLGIATLVCALGVPATSQDAHVETQPAVDQNKGGIPQVTAERPMSFWMEKKLVYSKSVLESLTKGDFDQLAKQSERMRLLGKMEGLVRRKNENYRVQLQTFDTASQELVRQANHHNAEGAALAFNQLTTSCVACHVLLREGVE